ncbi:MAG: hypothetical protein AAFU77_16730 [Myxococcota bacterium]
MGNRQLDVVLEPVAGSSVKAGEDCVPLTGSVDPVRELNVRKDCEPQRRGPDPQRQ